MNEFNIPKYEHDNVMSSFWQMLQECEAKAEANDDPVLKLLVEGWYRQWNTLTNGKCKARWQK